MSDQNELRDADSATVAEALRTYPLAPPPPTLLPGVVARLRTLPAGIRPKFRLGWFEWAISLFTTGLAGVGFVLWQSVPPHLVARLQIEWMLFLHQFAPLIQR